MKTADFLFEKPLGAGAFGKTCLVRLKRNMMPFVIKEQSSRNYKMIENEVRILKKMRHPNVVVYYDFWREQDKSFILMEYATRGTLGQLIDRRATPLKEQDALYLFSQIALGLDHIHRQRVLHRDLKPHNIMLTGQKGDVIKIGDFGVSKEITYTWGVTQVGTILYMAPEILEGKTYAYKCDIWSIGIILYEMLTKKFPFKAKNLIDMGHQMKQGVIRPVQAGLLSHSCVKLYHNLLKKNPTERPHANQICQCHLLAPYIRKIVQNENVRCKR